MKKEKASYSKKKRREDWLHKIKEKKG